MGVICQARISSAVKAGGAAGAQQPNVPTMKPRASMITPYTYDVAS